MDKFFRKTKGAISIFLVIVLLPMLTVASVFVDMSRINLANSMAESAGDLTLNTALTNYDAQLKNLYGLFATSQSMDELMESLEDYYRDSIVSAGVDSASADDYVGQIMDYLKTNTGDDDLMNIELTGFEVSVPEGGNLANPAILKSQIVEFMKYRAPLSLGTGFLDALSTMKDLSKQTQLVEDKNQFYEEHQDLLGTLEDAWWQIQLYQYADANDATGFPTGSYLTDQGSTMASNANLWKNNDIVEDTVKYLYRYSSFENLLTGEGKLQYEIILEYLCPDCNTACAENKTACTSCGTALSKDLEHQQWKITWQGSTSTVNPAYSESDPATAVEVLECLNAVLNATEGVDSYTTGDYSTAYEAACTPVGASIVERVYAVCIFNEEISKSSNYLKKVKILLQCLVNLNAAVNTCDAEELSNTKVVKIDGGNYKIETSSGGTPLSSFTSKNLNAHLNLNAGGYLNMFNQIISRVNGHYSATSGTVEQARTDVTKDVDAIRDQAYNYDKKLETKIGNLTEAIRLLNSVRAALTDPNSDYYQALNAWKTSANNLSENTMGKNDLAEIEDVTSILTTGRIDSLVTRLTSAKSTLEGIREQISKFKFAGTSVKDIKDNVNIYDICGMLSSWDSQIKEIVPQNDNAYDTIITTIEGTVEKGSITDTWGESDNSPDLTDQQRELYTWLYNNFYQKVENYSEATEPSQMTSADQDVSDMETSLENKANEQDINGDQLAESTQIDREVTILYECPECKTLCKKGTSKCTSCGAAMIEEPDYVKGTLPSTAWAETEKAIAEGKIETNADALLAQDETGDLLEELLELASNIGTELRDNLYVSEYIMSMFSYNTIEREIYVKETGSSENYGAFWTADDQGNYTAVKAFEEYSSKIETMTNNSINPGMNYLYGEEVEYILYGENGAEKVYATIFVIRFAMNTVYAFTDADINNVTLSAATALFGTPPLTPMIPFAKAAMTIGLAIAESAWDLAELRKGEEIPLMKSRETWIMSPNGLTNAVKQELEEQAKTLVDMAVDKATSEGYKLLSNAMEMTAEELQSYVNGSTTAIQELADAATDTVTDTLRNCANEALQKLVSLCNSENQKAMLEKAYQGMGATSTEDQKVKNVVAALKDWLDSQSSDDYIVYEAKKIAVDYLTANDGQIIVEVYNAIADRGAEESVTTPFDEKLTELNQAISLKISEALRTAGNALNEYVRKTTDELKDKLDEAAKKGGEELKTVLSEQISSAFGSIPTAEGEVPTATSTNGVMSSLLSWAYSDYLRIFVVVGLFANEESMLLRMADMIELNIQNMDGSFAVVTTTETQSVTKSRFFGLWKTTTTKDVEVNSINSEAFSLRKSYTYLTINATLQVQPLLMTLPFMADTVENQTSGTQWYEITYTGTLGY